MAFPTFKDFKQEVRFLSRQVHHTHAAFAALEEAQAETAQPVVPDDAVLGTDLSSAPDEPQQAPVFADLYAHRRL